MPRNQERKTRNRNKTNGRRKKGGKGSNKKRARKRAGRKNATNAHDDEEPNMVNLSSQSDDAGDGIIVCPNEEDNGKIASSLDAALAPTSDEGCSISLPEITEPNDVEQYEAGPTNINETEAADAMRIKATEREKETDTPQAIDRETQLDTPQVGNLVDTSMQSKDCRRSGSESCKSNMDTCNKYENDAGKSAIEEGHTVKRKGSNSSSEGQSKSPTLSAKSSSNYLNVPTLDSTSDADCARDHDNGEKSASVPRKTKPGEMRCLSDATETTKPEMKSIAMQADTKEKKENSDDEQCQMNAGACRQQAMIENNSEQSEKEATYNSSRLYNIGEKSDENQYRSIDSKPDESDSREHGKDGPGAANTGVEKEAHRGNAETHTINSSSAPPVSPAISPNSTSMVKEEKKHISTEADSLSVPYGTKPDKAQSKSRPERTSAATQTGGENDRKQDEKEAKHKPFQLDGAKERSNENPERKTGFKSSESESKECNKDGTDAMNEKVEEVHAGNTKGCNLFSTSAKEKQADDYPTSIHRENNPLIPTLPSLDQAHQTSPHHTNKSAQNIIVLFIQGMACGGCVKVVNNVLNSFDDVESAVTDLKSCTSTIYYNVPRLNLLPILVALDEIGMNTFLESQTRATTSHAAAAKKDNDISLTPASSISGSIISKPSRSNIGVIGQPSASSPLSLMDELRKGTTPLRRYQCSCGCEGCICSDKPVQKDDHGVDVTLTDLCCRLQDTLGISVPEANFRAGGGDKDLRDKLSKATFPCGCSRME